MKKRGVWNFLVSTVQLACCRVQAAHHQRAVDVEETMGVSLEIPHGTPWWASMAIWTVPGNDPLGPPGPPVAGQPCHVWARVLNTGNTPVQNATVEFYRARPGVGFDRTTATRIGGSHVSLRCPDQTDVLCLTPWVPAYVDAGHACLAVEVSHASLDPLPPGNAFHADTDRHVAQRNLSVVAMANGRFHFALEVDNPLRIDREFTIRVHAASADELAATARCLGIPVPDHPGALAELAVSDEPCPRTQGTVVEPPEIHVRVARHTRTGLTLLGRIAGEAALLHVEQLHDGCVVGGLSMLVVEAR
jgi:catechol 2,3-dioxygenase-like lactoylglutathione lyase family enzyme